MTSCHSTNDFAKDWCKSKEAKHGAVVICGEQTKGRGQLASTWNSEPFTNLTFSIVLKPKHLSTQEQITFNQVIAITLLSFLKQTFPNIAAHLKIKWPNDIYFKNKKIAGILVENMLQGAYIQHSIVGIGLNVNQQQFPFPHASSLSLALGQKLDLNACFHQLLQFFDENLKLEEHLQLANKASIHQIYLNQLYLWKQPHQFEAQGEWFEGSIVGVSLEGKLQVLVHEVVQEYDIKEIVYANN
jgi:BirA family biotin operon repressor/biotin-[acetyl-CoA-carboxylase] ligase